jgi:hypothetical protein
MDGWQKLQLALYNLAAITYGTARVIRWINKRLSKRFGGKS